MNDSLSRRVVAPEGFPGTVPRQANVGEKFFPPFFAVAIVPIPQEGDAGWTYLSLLNQFLGPVGNGLDQWDDLLERGLCKRLPHGLLDPIANIGRQLHRLILGLSQFGIMVGGALGTPIGVTAPTLLEGALFASVRGFLCHG